MDCWRAIAHMIEGAEMGRQLQDAMREALEPATFDVWTAVVEHHRKEAAAARISGLPVKDIEAMGEARAKMMVDQIGKRTAKAGSDAVQVEQAAREVVEVAAVSSRTAAVGSYRCRFPDTADPRTALRGGGEEVRVWVAPLQEVRVAITELIPPRRSTYTPVDSQGEEQLARVKALGISRILAAGTSGVFTMRAVTDAARRADGGSSREAVERAIKTEIGGTMLCSPTGHMWLAVKPLRGALRVAPFDVWQCAAGQQSEWAAEPVARMLEEEMVTESQMRSLFGQATAGAAMEVVLDRLMERLVPRWYRDMGRSIGAVGAGLGLTVLQVARRMECGVRWMMDGCPIAGPAGQRLARELGHEVELLGEATELGWAHYKYRVTVEVITLRCAPFVHGEGVEAALRELRAVMEGVAARRPRVVLYENTAGLWEKVELRKRVERLLTMGGRYAWESMRVSPHLHGGVGITRERVFYSGVMRGFERESEEGGGKVEVEEAEGREAGAVAQEGSGEQEGVGRRRAAAEADVARWGVLSAQEEEGWSCCRQGNLERLLCAGGCEGQLERCGECGRRWTHVCGCEGGFARYPMWAGGLPRSGRVRRQTQFLRDELAREEEEAEEAKARTAKQEAGVAVKLPAAGRRRREEEREDVQVSLEESAAVCRRMRREGIAWRAQREATGGEEGGRSAGKRTRPEGAEAGGVEAAGGALQGAGRGGEARAARGKRRLEVVPWLQGPSWCGVAPADVVEEARVCVQLDARGGWWDEEGRWQPRCYCGLAECVCGLGPI